MGVSRRRVVKPFLPPNSTQKTEARAKTTRASSFNCPTYFSHPLQEAQHSAES
jgi:hypothetical protein